MSSKFSLLLLLGLAIVVAGKLQLPKVKKIQTLKQTSEVLSAQNPRNSVGCFDYYRPTLDIITQQYEVQYTNCLLQYSFESDLEDDKWKSSRQQLEKSGSTSCNVLKDCSTIVGYVEAFECFAEAGAEQSKAMYEVSANATELAVQVEKFYQTLDTEKSICINNAERNYVEDTTTTYEGLNNCLSGKSPVPEQPTTSPVTEQPTTTLSTDSTPLWTQKIE